MLMIVLMPDLINPKALLPDVPTLYPLVEFE